MVDSRTAAHTLSQIAAYLELRGENLYKARAYETAAKGILALAADDIAPLLVSGEIGRVRGLGPATLSVVRDLVELGSSRYLDQLRETTPEGLLEMLKIPGLSAEKIHKIYDELQISDVGQLEEAARDGRLARIRGFGPKTAERVLKGIVFSRETGALELYPRARVQAEHLLAAVREHPEIDDAVIAGAIRRHREVAGATSIVARCRPETIPEHVATSFTRLNGVREATGQGSDTVDIRFVDGVRLSLRCVPAARFAVALWRATGSEEHVELVRSRLADRGFTLLDDDVLDGVRPLELLNEQALYRIADLAYVEPELREAEGEVDAAARHALPNLLVPSDIRGVLHCHTVYSDGKSTISEMARGAQARGWRYLGISDHSVAAFYASGLSREKVLAQFDEIDELNSNLTSVRVLKGIEADILADGRLDYDADLLAQFDFVIGSIHSRFGMDGSAMTERVLRALDDPFITVLAHPTGRLLLSREPYAIDVGAVIEKAADVGVAVELNADPRRLDLDWRHLIEAKRRGATVALGPDAHSVNALDNVAIGVGMARKGWLEANDLLNTRDVDGVLEFARARRR
ncbi:MAG TPA: PHP domain-containing protein [Gemmatimonadaceae bacterium]|nr:PHP domain-containing protein [Gemmatimonadaceae bacterium]